MLISLRARFPSHIEKQAKMVTLRPRHDIANTLKRKASTSPTPPARRAARQAAPAPRKAAGREPAPPPPPQQHQQPTADTPKDTTALQTLTFPSPAAFDAWLAAHHATSPGIWLALAKKAAGLRSITYDEAVGCALCHGWIDGQRRRHAARPDAYFVQRFTPRRRGSLWAARNVERVAALVAAGRMREAGMREVDAAKADGRWEGAYAPPSRMGVPADWEAALDGCEGEGKGVRAFWDGLNKTQRYSVLWRIETAKKASTRERRISEMIQMLREERTFH
jgi:uncharacterized protein YdeI (YjbR/CyaY-like superfamily)